MKSATLFQAGFNAERVTRGECYQMHFEIDEIDCQGYRYVFKTRLRSSVYRYLYY